jgi:hypothetical protein
LDRSGPEHDVGDIAVKADGYMPVSRSERRGRDGTVEANSIVKIDRLGRERSEPVIADIAVDADGFVVLGSSDPTGDIGGEASSIKSPLDVGYIAIDPVGHITIALSGRDIVIDAVGSITISRSALGGCGSSVGPDRFV